MTILSAKSLDVIVSGRLCTYFRSELAERFKVPCSGIYTEADSGAKPKAVIYVYTDDTSLEVSKRNKWNRIFRYLNSRFAVTFKRISLHCFHFSSLSLW
jgi:hypothetical protein